MVSSVKSWANRSSFLTGSGLRKTLEVLITTALLILAVLAIQHFSFQSKFPAVGIVGYDRPESQLVGGISEHMLARRTEESDLGFIKRITDTIHLTTYHCAPDEYKLTWIEQIIWWSRGKNFLFQQGILTRSRFSCGFCHQRAFLVHQILKQNNIESEVFGLNGHVVNKITLDGEVLFTDPDYGVGPFPRKSDPVQMGRIIESTYSKAPVGDIPRLTSMYLTIEDNRSYGEGYLEYIERQQIRFFHEANVLAYLSTVVVLLTLFSVWRKKRNQR